jgi:hypothetical protein
LFFCSCRTLSCLNLPSEVLRLLWIW